MADQNSISNYGLMSRAAQKHVMFIYGVMFTEFCDYTLITEAIAYNDNEPLGYLWCMCTSGLHEFYKLTWVHNKDMLSAFSYGQI